jgi:hypothetical protein
MVLGVNLGLSRNLILLANPISNFLYAHLERGNMLKLSLIKEVRQQYQVAGEPNLLSEIEVKYPH